MFGACFLCACVVQERFTLIIFTHRYKYTLIQTNEAVSRHSNSSTFSYCWYMTLDDGTLSYNVFIKLLKSTLRTMDWFNLENRTHCIMPQLYQLKPDHFSSSVGMVFVILYQFFLVKVVVKVDCKYCAYMCEISASHCLKLKKKKKTLHFWGPSKGLLDAEARIKKQLSTLDVFKPKINTEMVLLCN